MLLREAVGKVLRRLRLQQGRTLRGVARESKVSLPYLSEIERGLKEASSEVLASICAALGVSLEQFLHQVTLELTSRRAIAHMTTTCATQARHDYSLAA